MAIREVIFRGKRTYNGKWVEGSLVVTSQGGAYIISTVEDKLDATVLVNQCSLNVLPETVGQFTGAKTYSNQDDELHKIFEDDLCYVTEFDLEGNDEQHLCQVMFDCGTFYFEDVNSDWCRAFYEIGDIESDVELVGNIHDNPDMLKGGGNDG